MQYPTQVLSPVYNSDLESVSLPEELVVVLVKQLRSDSTGNVKSRDRTDVTRDDISVGEIEHGGTNPRRINISPIDLIIHRFLLLIMTARVKRCLFTSPQARLAKLHG